ncbi:hypothetical protein ACK6SQ_07240 [Enterobacter ludwigii]|uniref:hypothetical protein n=1 Tax=Enterobacter ludwigii TaxID=299767 RepID=UPI003C2FD896
MTREQMDELMTVAVNMQRDSEKSGDRPTAMFAYAVQVAVLELRQVRTDCITLAAENAGLNSFVDAFLSIAWQGGSADGAEIQDLALKHGLLSQEVYSADEHETLVDDPGNFEDGDPVYFRVETPATDAYLAEVRAQGVEQLAKAWYAIANETDPGISISDSSRLKYRQRADDAADFANEIRQEAAR